MVALSKSLEEELENGEVSRLPDDKFVEVMMPFSLQCHEELELLTKMLNQIQNTYMKVGDFFAFEVNEYPMEKCFSDINTFKEMFKQASKEGAKLLKLNETTNRPLMGEQQQKEKIALVAGKSIMRSNVKNEFPKIYTYINCDI